MPNPYAENLHTLRKIPLSLDVVDCIVFWSKNPRPFLKFLPEIRRMGYPFYFQFTLNPYEQAIEQNLPSLEERIDTFHHLSAMIGPERIVWRYDPVIIDKAHPSDWHGAQFERLYALLHADACPFTSLWKSPLRSSKLSQQVSSERFAELPPTIMRSRSQ